MNIEPFIFLGFQKFFQQRDIPMYITCLDLEGVLVPEIWIAFSEVSGIPELRRTTRDEPDYDKLMRWRMDILREHGLGLKEIQDVIAQIDPLPGAKDFLDELRAQTQAIIVSDTFEEFAQPLMKKLGFGEDEVDGGHSALGVLAHAVPVRLIGRELVAGNDRPLFHMVCFGHQDISG